MHSHLVTIEVGVEGRADKRVDLDGLALDQLGLESLDAEAVKRRCTVEQYRVFGDDLFENIPDHRACAFDHALGALDVLRMVEVNQSLHHERFEQLEGHLLGQAALVQFELRTDDDDRTAGVVDALAEEVLTESTLLALEHVGDRLERTVARSGDRTATPAVVEQRVDCLLKHALFVVDDDLRRTEIKQALEPVVSVDHAAVQVVEVGGCETATVELDHRTKFRRDHRDRVEDHAFGLVVAREERRYDLEPLERTGLLLTLAGCDDLAQEHCFGVEVKGLQALLDGSGAHVTLEVLAEAVRHIAVKQFVALEILNLQVLEASPHLVEAVDLTLGAVTTLLGFALGSILDLALGVGLGAFVFERFEVLFELLHTLVDFVVTAALEVLALEFNLRFQRRQVAVTSIFVHVRDHVGREVDDLFEVFRGEIKQVTESAGNTLEVPDVCDRCG